MALNFNDTFDLDYYFSSIKISIVISQVWLIDYIDGQLKIYIGRK